MVINTVAGPHPGTCTAKTCSRTSPNAGKDALEMSFPPLQSTSGPPPSSSRIDPIEDRFGRLAATPTAALRSDRTTWLTSCRRPKHIPAVDKSDMRQMIRVAVGDTWVPSYEGASRRSEPQVQSYRRRRGTITAAPSAGIERFPLVSPLSFQNTWTRTGDGDSERSLHMANMWMFVHRLACRKPEQLSHRKHRCPINNTNQAQAAGWSSRSGLPHFDGRNQRRVVTLDFHVISEGPAGRMRAATRVAKVFWSGGNRLGACLVVDGGWSGPTGGTARPLELDRPFLFFTDSASRSRWAIGVSLVGSGLRRVARQGVAL